MILANSFVARNRDLWCVQLVVAALLLFSYAYFYPGQGANQNSHFDLTRSLVEQHTFRIDSFHENTGDKALFQGHYYCDKAPGLSFVAMPAWAALRAVGRAFGEDPASPSATRWGLYEVTLIVVVLPTVMALLLLFGVAVNMATSVQAAVFATLALGLGTPIWCYATLFWGHATAGAFLVFAYIAARRLAEPSCSHPLLLGISVGIAGGFATLVEYPAAPAAALVGLYALANSRRLVGKMHFVALGIFAGAIICFAILGAYNRIAFGSVSAIGYKYNVNFPELKQTFFGVTYPRLTVLFHLLFTPYRGLLILAPVLLVVPQGLILMRQRTTALDTLVLTAIPVYYLLFNASFEDWDGGYTYGPRYLSAGLFFLVPALAMVWSSATQKKKIVVATLTLIGVALGLTAQATTPMPPDEWSYPILHLARAFFSGRVPMYPDTTGASNAGLFIGLHGIPSLIPLLAFWMLAMVWLALYGPLRFRTLPDKTGTPEGTE